MEENNKKTLALGYVVFSTVMIIAFLGIFQLGQIIGSIFSFCLSFI
tara:strand:+ start:233 stop:370 length:138 start_codon:yes stop_codon:yes gene_type:complete